METETSKARMTVHDNVRVAGEIQTGYRLDVPRSMQVMFLTHDELQAIVNLAATQGVTA